jgi:membrane protein DedA with SNARE-associated domain
LSLRVLLIFLVALLQEDLAIVTAGFMVAERQLPVAAALAAVYAGVLMNNLGVYGVGLAARRMPLARRRLIGERVERVGERLKARAIPAVLLCRLVPGTLLPTYLGCGWFGVPFSRFAGAAAAAAAVYVPLVFTLVALFGIVVLRRLSAWAWIPLAVIVVAGVMVANRARTRRRAPSRSHE